MLVTFHAHGETGRYHSYRRGSNNLDQSISDRSLKWTENKLVLVKIEKEAVIIEIKEYKRQIIMDINECQSILSISKIIQLKC